MHAPTFRAITTRYKGYAFRSRLEARWAVFFDSLGISWEYEPEGYELGNGLRYLPDFWLPEWGLWVEVKPGPPSDASREKAIRLAAHQEKPVLVGSGMPGAPCTFYYPGPVVGEYDAQASWGEDFVIYVQEPAPNMPCERIDVYPVKSLEAEIYGRAEDALEAARSARFEFGAKGAM